MNQVSANALASDYMQRDIITVSPDDTLREALSLMTENHVTGLPVMDGRSRCIGLITSSDILSYEDERADASTSTATAGFFDPETQQWEHVPLAAFGLEEFGDVLVGDVMTRDLIWVTQSTTLKEVARRMLRHRVHRVLVMDEDARLYGILSSFDFVRVVSES
ncbi:MAG: CBS domain-containing protein [Pirellulales bacterium]